MAEPSMEYPDPTGEKDLPKQKLKGLRKRYVRSFKWLLRPKGDFSHHVEGLEKLKAIGKDEVVVMTRQRNGIRFIRSFLRHYRSLGADRFVIVDERSEDGTPEYLATQDDVIVIPARTAFADALRGNYWFNAIFMALPKGQRIVYVDNDEFLVFGDGKTSLAGLFAAMKRKGRKRLATLMLDLYPPAPIAKAVFTGADDRLPWEVANLFDASGYRLFEGNRGMRVTGGVRKRLFGEELFLSKYSIMFNQRLPVVDHSVHTPQPLFLNRGPIVGALLHFKYFSDFIEEHKAIVERGVHNKGGKAYQTVLDQLEGVNVGEEFDFSGPDTLEYQGPEQLNQLGLITKI